MTLASPGRTDASPPSDAPPDHESDIVYPSATPFILVHLACLGIFWTGVTTSTLILCAVLYCARMFFVTAGYHRYFSHRSYKTSRVGQFLLAFCCQTSAQRGVLWWAAKHRAHHRYSDTPLDSHSPRHRGFWFSHVGWIFSRTEGEADYTTIADLTKYPELVWLDRHRYLPAAILGVAVWLLAGWTGLVVGFLLSTVLLFHGTFAINSLAHVVGRKRYVTGDDSRNNWWLALIAFGEGWHNNHHQYQTSTRQGFFWWEIDVTFYLLKLLSFTGLVWDLRAPPVEVIRAERQLGRGVLDKVARQLAESFPLESICEQIREAWSHKPSLEELRAGARRKLTEIQSALSEKSFPQIPSLEQLKTRAREMFADTPCLDQIVQRGRQVILELLSQRICEPALA